MGRLNKPSREGYTYRSPGQTNAKDVTPNLREDVIASQSADNERIKRGLNADAARANNRKTQQEAGGRAITRTGGRAGLAALAGEAGYALGRKIDEETGVGKKLIDKTVGPSIDRAVASKDRVTLSPEAKARIEAGELEEKASVKPMKRTMDSASPEGKMRPGRNEEIDDETRESAGGYKRGGKVNSASRRGDGIAQRGKTRGKMC
jgi:hypothetical protein